MLKKRTIRQRARRRLYLHRIAAKVGERRLAGVLDGRRLYERFPKQKGFWGRYSWWRGIGKSLPALKRRLPFIGRRASCGLPSDGPGEGKQVCFRLRAPRAREVILCGTLNRRWEKTRYLKRDEKGDWYTSLELEPGEYEYRFLVDGEWRNACDTEVVSGPNGVLNRVQVSP